jgi:hypothetical protein
MLSLSRVATNCHPEAIRRGSLKDLSVSSADQARGRQ